jgi:hypothetical protein
MQIRIGDSQTGTPHKTGLCLGGTIQACTHLERLRFFRGRPCETSLRSLVEAADMTGQLVAVGELVAVGHGEATDMSGSDGQIS